MYGHLIKDVGWEYEQGVGYATGLICFKTNEKLRVPL
jgi:hypothetical protein